MSRAHRDKDTPWNPNKPAVISPTEFEAVVLNWLREMTRSRGSVSFEHQGLVSGGGGDYSIDILASLELFDGAEIKILVECKNHRRRIERDHLLVLESKLRDVGAHKGLLVSNSGFQKGAIAFAKERGIATVTLVKGAWIYETKNIDDAPTPPPWADPPEFVGLLLGTSERGILTEVLPDRLHSLMSRLRE